MTKMLYFRRDDFHECSKKGALTEIKYKRQRSKQTGSGEGITV